MLKTIILLAFLPSGVFAQSAYYGLTQSTTTGRAAMTLSGQLKVAASSATASTATIILQGSGGRITANSATFMSSATVRGPLSVAGPVASTGAISAGSLSAAYGVAAATAAFSSSASASAFFGDGSHLNLPQVSADTAAIAGNLSSEIANRINGDLAVGLATAAIAAQKLSTTTASMSGSLTVASSVTASSYFLSDGTPVNGSSVTAVFAQVSSSVYSGSYAVHYATAACANGVAVSGYANGTDSNYYKSYRSGENAWTAYFNVAGTTITVTAICAIPSSEPGGGILTGTQTWSGGNAFTLPIAAQSSVTASAFYGDGSHLSGISAGDANLASTQTWTGENTFNSPIYLNSTIQSTGGNSRGINAVDLQIIREENTQVASGYHSTLLGGENNTVGGENSVISGGKNNFINQSYSAIGGGRNNVLNAGAQYSSIGGGLGNQISSMYSVIPGGRSNTATGLFSFAAGYHAHAAAMGAFALAGYYEDDEFYVDASSVFGAKFTGGYWLTGGNVGIGTTSPAERLHVYQGSVQADYGVTASTAVFSSTVTVGGLTNYGAKTHAQLQALACAALPCAAAASDLPYDIFSATGTSAGQWQSQRTGNGP